MQKKRNFRPIMYFLGFIVLALLVLIVYIMVSQPEV
jgi:hypothetical protein